MLPDNIKTTTDPNILLPLLNTLPKLFFITAIFVNAPDCGLIGQ
jgi:hypothetical protein